MVVVIKTIPLSLMTVGPDGKTIADHSVVLNTREKFIPLDMPFKPNAGTVGCLYVIPNL